MCTLGLNCLHAFLRYGGWVTGYDSSGSLYCHCQSDPRLFIYTLELVLILSRTVLDFPSCLEHIVKLSSVFTYNI